MQPSTNISELADRAAALASSTGTLVALLVAGLVVLLAGGKLFKPLIVLVSLVAGGVAGSMVVPNFIPSGINGVPAGVAGVLLGGVVGLLLGVALFRLAVAATASVGFAAGSIVIAACYLSTVPGAFPTDGLSQSSERLTLAGGEIIVQQLRIDAPEPAAAPAFGEAVSDAWSTLPTQSRATLLLAALGGALLGLGMGSLAPPTGAASVMAMVGSGAVLAAAATLARRQGMEFDIGVIPAAAAWLGLSFLGTAVQRRRRPKPAAQPAPAPAAAPA